MDNHYTEKMMKVKKNDNLATFVWNMTKKKT